MLDEDENIAANTDREIWREREGDYYADSIHVTEDGKIGISCAGHVIVMPIREWHKLVNYNYTTAEQYWLCHAAAQTTKQDKQEKHES